MSFATLPADVETVRVVVVGAGGMGRVWLRTLKNHPGVEVVGIVDVFPGAAESSRQQVELPADVATGTSLPDMIALVKPHAIVNVTIPEAHHQVTSDAVFAGLPVISEKPLAPTLAIGLATAAAADASGQLVMVSQSRRYFRALAAFKREARALGDIGLLTCFYSMPQRFEGFRAEMAHVLLGDMAIHPFDAARYVLERVPVAVYCDEFNPDWSPHAGGGVATAIFEFEGGARFTYNGSWSTEGFDTPWNGQWRASAAAGTATWDGDGTTLVSHGGDVAIDPDLPEEVEGSLAEFLAALRGGDTPSGEVHSNALSLAMVEAAIRSAETRTRVLVADVIEDAYAEAVAAETDARVAAALGSWSDLHAVIH